MRHRKKGKKLNRNSAQRRALFKNLARGFFVNQGKVKTTLAKAKAVQGLVERMITRAKKADLSSRRWLNKYFQNPNLVNQIVDTYGKKMKKRPGGYTRIIKLKKRRGDNATLARLELVDELEEGAEK